MLATGSLFDGRQLLRTAASGSVALSLYPLAQPRDERRAERHPPSAPVGRTGGAELRVVVRWPPALRTAASGSVALSLYPLAQPRDERRAERRETRRLLANHPVLPLKSRIPRNVYASTIGLSRN